MIFSISVFFLSKHLVPAQFKFSTNRKRDWQICACIIFITLILLDIFFYSYIIINYNVYSLKIVHSQHFHKMIDTGYELYELWWYSLQTSVLFISFSFNLLCVFFSFNFFIALASYVLLFLCKTHSFSDYDHFTTLHSFPTPLHFSSFFSVKLLLHFVSFFSSFSLRITG